MEEDSSNLATQAQEDSKLKEKFGLADEQLAHYRVGNVLSMESWDWAELANLSSVGHQLSPIPTFHGLCGNSTSLFNPRKTRGRGAGPSPFFNLTW